MNETYAAFDAIIAEARANAERLAIPLRDAIERAIAADRARIVAAIDAEFSAADALVLRRIVNGDD